MVDRRADHREIDPPLGADIAELDIAAMQRHAEAQRRLAFLDQLFIQFCRADDGFLGGGQRPRLDWPPKSAAFIQAREIRGETWLQLEVRATEACTDTEAPPKATIWVPFHDARRRPTLWFFSRGC